MGWHPPRRGYYSMLAGRRGSRNRLLLLIVVVFLVLLGFRMFRRNSVDWDLMPDIGEGGIARARPGDLHERWIVVTTIHTPSQALIDMAKLPEWQVLVVGDQKTPPDWKIDEAIYLDVRKQKALGYRTTSLLPQDSYSRKVVGYLYAIEHGAKYLYETDDDNYPDRLHLFDLGPFSGYGLVVDTTNITYNPYGHFGQSTMWPRGFPLTSIAQKRCNRYKLCNVRQPALQQGVVNGDPDVDAIFRLTRVASGKRLNVTFDQQAPPVILPLGTFAPHNTQNTLYLGPTMWGLIMPVSMPDRALDIYRSYFVQRLMWLLSETIAFYPPTATQVRNPHNYISDFKDETTLYAEMDDYIKYLSKWTCNKVFFFDCMSLLAHDLSDVGFWKPEDAFIVDAWVADLANVGYVPPTMHSTNVCHSKNPLSIVYYPLEQNTTFSHVSKSVLPEGHKSSESVTDTTKKLCGPLSVKKRRVASNIHADILLIIQIQKDTNVISTLEALYSNRFPHRLYCGKNPIDSKLEMLLKKWHVSYVSPNVYPSGIACTSVAMKMNYKIDAYMFITDTMFLNDGALKTKHANLMGMTGEVHVYKPEMEHQCQNGEINCKVINKKEFFKINSYIRDTKFDQLTQNELHNCFKKLASTPGSGEMIVHLEDLALYVPARMMDNMQELARVFMETDRTQHMFLTVLLLECLEIAPDYFSFNSIQQAAYDTKTSYIYPFNMDAVPDINSLENKRFCQAVVG